MSKKKTNRIAEEKAFDYQRALGMIDSVSDDHVIARRMGFYDGFIAGAKWQKEQMLKDAVEGEVCILPGRATYVEEKDNESLKQYLLDHFKDGDKVRVIIVKEEEE